MKVNLTQGAFTLNLEIPEAVEAKIRHLCARVHDVEWSGTLFYRTEGSFDDGTFKAICLDICVMDIGSGGFTSYDDTSDIIAYRIDHPELLQEGVYEGLIHSHNNMSAFFSGTDTHTLLEEGLDLNHFLSLIVCNKGIYVARITRKLVKKVKTEAHIVYTESSYYNTYEDEKIEVSNDKVTEKDSSKEEESIEVEWFEMAINKAEVPTPFNEIDERLAEIRKNKAARVNVNKPAQPSISMYLPPYPSTRQDASQIIGNKPKPTVALSTVEQTPERNYLSQPQPKEGELFPDHEPAKVADNPLDGPDSPLNNEKYPLALLESADDKVIESLCTQLLTGSMLATRIDLEKWVTKMDDIYERRFGDLNDKRNCQRLESWIELLVEQLITYTNDPEMEQRVYEKHNTPDIESEDELYNEDDFTQLYAYDMIKFLLNLPDSAVKELMIDELKTYLPDGVEEYI